MDLPKCPACGQSVLDDDAAECPFCGSAMDGSSKKSAPSRPAAGAKKTSAAKSQTAGPQTRKPADTSAATAGASGKASDDDPFAIAQSPAAKSAVQCARRPEKGRSQRVVCPMCETQGFIPKAALGRQVRCANPECMVPVFTAASTDGDKAVRAPSRISDDEVVSRARVATSADAKNPMMIYGIVGGVLLVLTIGLVMVLNRPGIDQLGAVPYTPGDFDGEDENDTPTGGKSEKEPEVVDVDHSAKAAELAEIMIQSARISSGNRDKAYCRRLTGDVFLRLGLQSQALEEFNQMKMVASQKGRDTQYYQIVPLITNYWKLKAAGDASAETFFNQAKQLAAQIPESGLQALESGISMAAALADQGDIEAALNQITALQRDQTIASQIDTVRLGAWLSCSSALKDSGITPLPVLEVFAWNEPLMTAVGVHLAAARRWESAIQWASSTKGLTSGDTFGVIARRMAVAGAAAAETDALIVAAAASGNDVHLRVLSTLARSSADAWQKAKAASEKVPAAAVSEMPNISGIIESRSPDVSSVVGWAEAMADFVIAGAAQNDDAAVSSGITSLTSLMMSVVPPTADVRRASTEIELNENTVEKKIEQELRLSDASQVKSRFIAYRRGVDRLARAAEERRLRLLLMLCRVIENGGLSGLKAAMAADTKVLGQEVGLDQLNGLLYVAAVSGGTDFPEISQAAPGLAVPLSGRMEAIPEISVVKGLVEAWQGFAKTGTAERVVALESGNQLQGLRAAMATAIFDAAAKRSSSARKTIEDVTLVRNELWREYGLEAVSRTLANKGHAKDAQETVQSMTATPTQRVVALYGLALGELDQQSLQK